MLAEGSIPINEFHVVWVPIYQASPSRVQLIDLTFKLLWIVHDFVSHVVRIIELPQSELVWPRQERIGNNYK